MESKLRLFIFATLTALIFFSCTMGEEDSLGCRVSMEETSLDQVRLRVRLEDESGNALTGARVLLETPSAEVSWLYFDSETYLYTTSLSGLLSGDYEVSVESSLGTVDRVVPFVALTEEPEIVTLQDASGTSAGTGADLDPGTAISVAWEAVEGAVVYKGTLLNGTTVVSVFSSYTPNYLFPANQLQFGKTYGLTIEAQYLAGDPFLRDDDYYAFSYTESPEYYFSTR